MPQSKKGGNSKASSKPAAKRGSAGGAKQSSGKPRGGLAQAVQPDAQLAAIVGNSPLTRAEMTKKVWDHIKKNDLQDKQNKRMINADAKLRPIFGKDQVSMFEMTRLVNQHVK